MGLAHASQGHPGPPIGLFPAGGHSGETHGQDGRANSHTLSNAPKTYATPNLPGGIVPASEQLTEGRCAHHFAATCKPGMFVQEKERMLPSDPSRRQSMTLPWPRQAQCSVKLDSVVIIIASPPEAE